ncbi:MAG: autotransporter domain-containing protein [Chlamydiota bacterium]
MAAFRKFSFLLFSLPLLVEGATIVVNSNADTNASGTLRFAIINSSSGDTLDCTAVGNSVMNTITLTSPLPAVSHSVMIINNGSSPVTVDGTLVKHYQAFSAAAGTLSIQNFHILNAGSQGGNGGAGFGGGGGGVGGGGGLYVHNGTNVSLTNVQFLMNQAVGGAGGNGNGLGGGGGGGGGFAGGLGGVNGLTGGGGGGGGNSGAGEGGPAGGAASPAPPLATGTYGGAGGGGTSFSGGNSGGAPLPTTAFTGGAAAGSNGGGGAGAGGAGDPASATFGGTGGVGIGTDGTFGGGGGGGAGNAGSAGGAGTGTGGGGGAAIGAAALGGAGGTNGGGGGGSQGTGGKGGFGAGGGGGNLAGGTTLFGGGVGGTGAVAGGGGGAALGGAIFIQNGGTLTIGDGFGATGNVVTGGTAGAGGGATAGQAQSPDIFVRSGGSLIFNLTLTSVTVGSAINSDQGAGGGTGGGLTLQGTKLLTLSVPNTYSGGTNIQGGVLNAVADSSLGNPPDGLTITTGTFQAGGSFSSPRTISLLGAGIIDTAGNNLSLSGVISGSGGFTKIGTGTLTLSGVNTFAGGTTVNGGTLSIPADTALGNAAAPLALNASTLQITASITSARTISLTGANIIDPQVNTVTLSGPISGAGSFTKVNGGLLILSGTNSYSGGTVVNGGTLQGDTNSLQGSIQDNATLIFNQSFSGTYAGVLTGNGQLTKQGASTIQFSGQSPAFTGPTLVSQGTLNVTGSIAGSSLVTVALGSTLSGTGTVGSVSNSGQITPGNSGVGILTVNGTLSLAGTSNVNIDIAPTAASQINVAGTAMLNGALTIIPTPGFYGLNATYTILTSAGLGFSTFSSPPTSTDPNFVPTVSYTPTSVILFVKVVNPFLFFPFSNENTRSVGNNIGELNTLNLVTPDLLSVVDSFAGQSVSAINNALDQMHPAQYSALAEFQAEVGGQLISLFHRKPYLRCGGCCESGWRIWAEPFGNALEEKNRGEEIGFIVNTAGIAAGLDKAFFDCWTIGIGGAWDSAHLKWDDKRKNDDPTFVVNRHRGHADIEGYYGAIYTDYQSDNFYLGAAFTAGKDSYDTLRHIQFFTTDRQAKANYHALDLVGGLTTAYFFGSPVCLVYPYANVDLLYLKADSFNEQGASGLDLNVHSYRSTTLRSEAGLALQVQDTNADETMCISPLFAFGWVMLYPIHRDSYTSTFAGEPIPFRVKGWDRTWQLLSLNFGLTINYRSFGLSLEYNVQVSTDSDTAFYDQRGGIRLDWKW